MIGTVELSTYLKEKEVKSPIAYLGSYVQALPKKSLVDEESIDFVFINEGVYSLHKILKIKKYDDINLRKFQEYFLEIVIKK